MAVSSRMRWSLAVCAVIAAAAGGWWLGRQPPTGATGTSQAPTPVAAPAMPEAQSATETAAAREPAAAPPVAPQAPESIAKRPLLDQLDVLAQSARGGDQDAACRLGTAVLRCFEHADTRQPIFEPGADATWFAQATPEQQARVIDTIAKMGERARRMDEYCRGVTRTAHQRAALEFLLVAARAGNSVARHEFIAADLEPVDLLRDPQLARLYADNAPAVFRAMWDEGDPRAIDLLVRFAGGRQASVQAGSHAIPPQLLDSGLVRALRDVQSVHLFGFERQPAPHEEPIGPAARADAQRIWDERFETSGHVAARREQREQRRGRAYEQTLDPSNVCEEEVPPLR